MPRDVAMEWPDTWIVRQEIHDHVAWAFYRIAWLENKCVSPHRIAQVCFAIPGPQSFSNDPEIVAVEMHGMTTSWSVRVIDKHDADGRTVVEVVDIPFRVGI